MNAVYYHRTNRVNAEEILIEGFHDRTGTYLLAGAQLTGVWVSDSENLGVEEFMDGGVLIQIMVDADLPDDFEVAEAGKGYREWCVPAELLNRGRILEVDE